MPYFFEVRHGGRSGVLHCANMHGLTEEIFLLAALVADKKVCSIYLVFFTLTALILSYIITVWLQIRYANKFCLR